MTINDIQIPDAGTTKQYIPDAVGGWVYVVTTTTDVQQLRLDSFNATVDAAKQKLADAQAEVDELTQASTEVETAVAALPLSVLPSEQVTPPEAQPPV